MPYRIIIAFPSEEVADQFCAGLIDGFGENHCDFERSIISAPDGMPLWLCNEVYSHDEEEEERE